jgi:hypothetical protein
VPLGCCTRKSLSRRVDCSREDVYSTTMSRVIADPFAVQDVWCYLLVTLSRQYHPARSMELISGKPRYDPRSVRHCHEPAKSPTLILVVFGVWFLDMTIQGDVLCIFDASCRPKYIASHNPYTFDVSAFQMGRKCVITLRPCNRPRHSTTRFRTDMFSITVMVSSLLFCHHCVCGPELVHWTLFFLNSARKA